MRTSGSMPPSPPKPPSGPSAAPVAAGAACANASEMNTGVIPLGRWRRDAGQNLRIVIRGAGSDGREGLLAAVRRGGRAWPRSRHPDEAQQRDLRRRADAFRRPPVARAPARVDPHPAPAMQARGERLLQPDEKGPGQELAAMGVPRELQVEARRLGGRGAARLV